MCGYNDYNLLCRSVIFTIIIRNCVVPGAALVEGSLLELVQTGCLSSSCPVSGSGLNDTPDACGFARHLAKLASG